MKKTILLMASATLMLASSSAFGQSLADVAKKEKERREAIKVETKVITDSDKDKYASGAVTTSSMTQAEPEASKDGEPTKAATDASKEPAAADPDEPADFSGRPESFWRQTMTDARQKVTKLENEATALTLKLAYLQNTFYSESSGYRQQDIQKEIQKAYYEQDLNKKDLEAARRSLEDLQNEARKSGALPGWLEPKAP